MLPRNAERPLHAHLYQYSPLFKALQIYTCYIWATYLHWANVIEISKHILGFVKRILLVYSSEHNFLSLVLMIPSLLFNGYLERVSVPYLQYSPWLHSKIGWMAERQICIRLQPLYWRQQWATVTSRHCMTSPGLSAPLLRSAFLWNIHITPWYSWSHRLTWHMSHEFKFTRSLESMHSECTGRVERHQFMHKGEPAQNSWIHHRGGGKISAIMLSWLLRLRNPWETAWNTIQALSCLGCMGVFMLVLPVVFLLMVENYPHRKIYTTNFACSGLQCIITWTPEPDVVESMCSILFSRMILHNWQECWWSNYQSGNRYLNMGLKKFMPK